MFLKVVEFTLVALLVLFVITQVLIPLWKSRPLFPYFSKTKMDEEVKKVNELADRVKTSKLVKETLAAIEKETK